jgi:hypothetical protein
MIWSRSEIRLARRVPLKPLLDGLGYQLDPRPNGNHAIARQTPEIVVKEHFWVCPDSGASGNAIDFLVRVRGLPFNEAMRLLKPFLRPEAS